MSAVRGLYKLGAAALVAIQAACVSVPTKPEGQASGPAEPNLFDRAAAATRDMAARAEAAAREAAARAEATVRGGAESAASSVGAGKKPDVAALENGRIPAAAKGKTGLFVSNPADVKPLTEEDHALAKAVIDGAKTGQQHTLPAKPGTVSGFFGRMVGAASQGGARVYGVAYGQRVSANPKDPSACITVPIQIFEGTQQGTKAPLMNAQPSVTGVVQNCPAAGVPGVTQTPTGVKVEGRMPTTPSIFTPKNN